MPGFTAFLLIALCAGVPPAFASLTSTQAQHFLPARLPKPSSALSSSLTFLLPSHIAAHAVVSTRQEDWKGAIGALGSMAGCLFLTGGAAFWASRGADKTWNESEGRAVAPRKRLNTRTVAGSRAGPFLPTAALVQTEWRLLLRTPQNYLPLRKPARLLLLGVFAFLSPECALLQHLSTERGVTIFFTSHVFEMAERLCTRIAVLQEGRIRHQGTSQSSKRTLPVRE